MLREVEASVARAGAPAEHVTVTEDWKPELTKYAEQLAKSEEENKALVNKVSSIPVLISYQPLTHVPTCLSLTHPHALPPSLRSHHHFMQVMAELESIQEEMGTRPSEAQVAQMMHAVEDSLKR